MIEVTVPLEQLREAPWNANEMTPQMRAKLRESVMKFGVVENLVVRSLPDDSYEVLSGNQRLTVYRELGMETAPCVVVSLDDPRAKLLAHVMNRTRGEDDLGLKAELVRSMLDSLTQDDLLALLPETPVSLMAFATMGRESLAQALQNWERIQRARLHHLTFQLTSQQLKVVKREAAKIQF